MSRRKLKCPACDKPAVPFDATDDRGRRAVTEGDKDPCPHCGVRLYVHITDDYPDDCRVTVYEGKDPKALVKKWNEAHPVGARVRYWPVRPTSSTLPIETRTRSEAFVSGPDHASIFVEGIVGSVNLSTHVDALPDEPKPAPAEGAAEGRYAVLFGDGSGGYFGVLDKRGNEVASRDVAAEGGENKLYDGKLVRILDDGAHEAAVEAARREERERVLGEIRSTVALATETERKCEKSAKNMKMKELAAKHGAAVSAFEQVLGDIEAAKGQTK